MKRTHRLRRLASVAVLGVGTVGGAVGLAAGTAGAATTTVGSLSTKTATTIPNGTTSNQRIGTLVVKVDKTAPVGRYSATFTVADTGTPAGTTLFTVPNNDRYEKLSATGPETGLNCLFNTPGATSPTATCTVTKTGTTTTVVLTASTMRVSSTAARGKVKVTVKMTTPATSQLSPNVVYPATYTLAAPVAPATVTLNNTTGRPIPPAGEGATGAAAGNWLLTLTNGTGATATTQGVGASGHVKITVEPHTGTSHCTATDTVAFSGKPTVKVTKATGTTVPATKIKVSTSLSGNNGCTGFFAPNVLTVTFTSAVHFTKKAATLQVSISGVKYGVAPKTTTGKVVVKDAFYTSSSAATATNATTDQGTTATSSNAVVSKVYVATKPVTMAPTSFDQPIGTVSVVSTVGTAVPAGFVCVTLHDSTRNAGATTGASTRGSATGAITGPKPPNNFTTVTFNATATPKVTNGTTVKFVTAGSRPYTLSFAVTGSSSATTYTVSGLAVDSNTRTTGMPLLTAYYSASATCATASGAPTDHVAVAFMNSQSLAHQIYGVTADATAAAELEAAFPASTGSNCPIVTSALGTSFLGKTERPVVLATDVTYPDALASQYLAGQLTTGTLLTPVTALSQVTINAIQTEGINHVYVVGGPLAVSTAVVKQLQTMNAYNCGGSKIATNLTGQPIKIRVTRIAGQTAYDTAQQIAEYVPAAFVGSITTPGAYGGSTGRGLYNDTTGAATAKPVSGGSLKTAILASGAEFQDSEAASALAYQYGLPVLLTTPTGLSAQAKNAIQTLHIRQVVVMGGPLAIANTVVASLQAMKVTGQAVSVLRIAGKDYTDTAVQLAKFEQAATTTGLGWTSTTAFVARGNGYSDGIAGAVIEHSRPSSPMLLTESPTTVGPYLTTYLKAVGTGGAGFGSGPYHISQLMILGGPLAITPTLIVQMEQDLKS